MCQVLTCLNIFDKIWKFKFWGSKIFEGIHIFKVIQAVIYWCFKRKGLKSTHIWLADQCHRDFLHKQRKMYDISLIPGVKVTYMEQKIMWASRWAIVFGEQRCWHRWKADVLLFCHGNLYVGRPFTSRMGVKAIKVSKGDYEDQKKRTVLYMKH